MKTNVLVTSASRKVSLIKSFKKAIELEGGGKIIAVDINPLSAALYHADLAFLVPKSSDDNFIPKILELCKKEGINLVVPTRDEELRIFAGNKDKFEDIGTKVMVSDPKVIDVCNDKLEFIRFCKKNDLLVPKTFHINQINENNLNFPLFVRNRFGKGSKNAFKIRNKKELEFFTSQLDEPILQEYCKDREYTIDLFSDFDGNVISVVPRERIYVLGGESFISKTYKNRKLMKDNIQLAEELNLIGHNTIQCFFDGDKKTKFIEVNPRYGGGANLGFEAGANTPLFLIQLIKGKKIKNKIGKFQDSFIMLRYTEDVFLDEKTAKSVKKID